MKTYYDYLQLQKDMESCLFVREKRETPEYIHVELTFIELIENATKYPGKCKYLLAKVDSIIIDLTIAKLKQEVEYKQQLYSPFFGYFAVVIASLSLFTAGIGGGIINLNIELIYKILYTLPTLIFVGFTSFVLFRDNKVKFERAKYIYFLELLEQEKNRREIQYHSNTIA
ncbi:hypothetical protein ACTHP3_00880 [Shouchella rhizosphaerae]|uniref:hypothetical protein n=1 Tax=Shouchella rhizosphaerae TaxID=866786 RepID=UPI003F818299